MATKVDELRNADSCFNKAASDEPIFVLRGKDPLAGAAVRLWATLAVGVHGKAKIAEAVEHSKALDRYAKKLAKVTAPEVIAPAPVAAPVQPAAAKPAAPKKAPAAKKPAAKKPAAPRKPAVAKTPVVTEVPPGSGL